MNYLKSFDSKTFSSLKNLAQLELRFNLLADLDAQLFTTYNYKLKELSLENNQLTKVDVNALNKLCLKEFSIENNPVRQKLFLKQVRGCMTVSYLKADDKSIVVANKASSIGFSFINFFIFSTLMSFF
jgi:Leucine-rich repeat (LRR) protein